MEKSKTKLVGTGIAFAAAFVFLAIVALNFPALTEGMFGKIDKPAEKLTLAQIVVSFFGFIGAISAFSLAIYQYLKSARWKRMEFIANEIKEFEADPVVQNALTMIDWGRRKINLNLVSNPTEHDLKIVTRTVQWKALLPHKVKHAYAEYQSNQNDEKAEADGLPVDHKTINTKLANDKDTTDKIEKTKKDFDFTSDEAVIRDTYDVFLTRLDRFQTFIKANLIEPNELKPFIDYWIDALTNTKNLNKDAAWKFTLLTYINYYRYSGVIELFKNYNLKIDPKGKDYQNVMSCVQDKILAERLKNSVDLS